VDAGRASAACETRGDEEWEGGAADWVTRLTERCPPNYLLGAIRTNVVNGRKSDGVESNRMTLSKPDRNEDLNNAVRMMMEELGPRWYGSLFPFGENAPYDRVLPTTWRELTRRGYVKDWGQRRYEFTATGWIYGVALLDLHNQPGFRGQMSRLSATLKGYVKGRAEDALKDICSVAKDSDVGEDFVRNAIEGKLLDLTFNLRGAYFPPEDQMHQYIVIPLDYGLEP
jgi:hypothetical protein